MKFGMRKPSLKRAVKAATTGKLKRKIKKALIPGYGKKGMGWLKDPKKAAYNKVYNKTTFGVKDLFKPHKNNPAGATTTQQVANSPSKQPTKAGTVKIAGGILGGFFVLLLIVGIFGGTNGNENALLASSSSLSASISSSKESASNTSQLTSSLPSTASSDTASTSSSDTSKASSESTSKKPSGNTTTKKSTSTPAASSKPSQQQTPSVSSSKPVPPKQDSAPAQQPQQSTTVYISKTGEKYHKSPNCGRMKNGTPKSLDWAKSNGYAPCQTCYG